MKTATINELLNSGANLTIQVTADQLREAFLQWGAELLKAVKPEPADELLTTAEVMGELQVSRSTVNNWVRRGWLNPIRQGAVVRYRRSEIMDFTNI